MRLLQNLQTPPQTARRLIEVSIRFRLFIGLLLIVAMVWFMTFRINYYAEIQSDQRRFDEAVAGIKIVKFNEEAIEKIKSLKDQGAKVMPQLPQNRTNPF